jgi:rhomboid protease GluP
MLLFVSVVYWLDLLGLANRLPAIPENVFRHGEYWRLLTSIGAHADFRHFLSNGIVFGVLSFLLYGYFGAVVYPVLTWGLGCVVTAVSLSTYAPNTRLLGASGVVYLMAGFWLTSFLLIERRLTIGKRLLRAIGFGLIVLVPTAWDPSVSYRTHGIGFIAGALYAIAYFFMRKDALRKAERVEWD